MMKQLRRSERIKCGVTIMRGVLLEGLKQYGFTFPQYVCVESWSLSDGVAYEDFCVKMRDTIAWFGRIGMGNYYALYWVLL